MEIKQLPGGICLAGNLKEIIVSGIDTPVFVKLSADGEVLLEETYYPVSSAVTIDIKETVRDSLKTTVPETRDIVTRQPLLARNFVLETEKQKIMFRAIGGGIDNPGLNIPDFLECNFLNLCCPEKVFPDSFQYLTYYTQENCYFKIRIDTGSRTYDFSRKLDPDHAYTFNVSPSLLSYLYTAPVTAVTAWIEACSGYHLAEASFQVTEPSDQDQNYLFVNSLGGIDTLTCTGELSFTHSVENSLFIHKKKKKEANRQLSVLYKQNTGYLTEETEFCFRDFIQSYQKYRIHEGKIIPILIESQENEYIRFGLNYYEFEYQYAEQNGFCHFTPKGSAEYQFPPFTEKLLFCFDKRRGNEITDRTRGYKATLSEDGTTVTFPAFSPDILNKNSPFFWNLITGSGREWKVEELTGTYTIDYATYMCTRMLFFRDVTDGIDSVLPVLAYRQPLNDREIREILAWLKEYYFLEDGTDHTLLTENIPEENNNIFITDHSTLK